MTEGVRFNVVKLLLDFHVWVKSGVRADSCKEGLGTQLNLSHGGV